MKEILVAKIYAGDKLLKKYLNPAYRQKYFTQEEINWIEKNCKGSTFIEKLQNIKNVKSKVIIKKKPKKSPRYVYNNIDFYSAEALAYYIIHPDISLNKKMFKYFNNENIEHAYFPEFVHKGKILSTKAPTNKWTETIVSLNNIQIITKEEIKECFVQLRKKRIKLSQFKRKIDEDIKRKIIELNDSSEIPTIHEKRNSNIKIKFFCEKCHRVDFQSPKTVLHFGNLYCSSCRRRSFKNKTTN